MKLGGGKWSGVGVDGAGWNWVHGLAIPVEKLTTGNTKIPNATINVTLLTKRFDEPHV